MKKKYEIVLEFVKDISSETKNAETYIYVKENIKSYILSIDINTLALKNKLIEINTKLTFEDKKENEKKSFFNTTFATVIKVAENIEDKKIIEKIVLCDVQKEIYPKLEKVFCNVLHDSGYTGVKIKNKIDFEKLYREKFS